MRTQYFLDGDFSFREISRSSHRLFDTRAFQTIQTRMIIAMFGLIGVIDWNARMSIEGSEEKCVQGLLADYER
jgi:hypothetical protein